MSLSTLPLSYCTNVHPGTSIAQVRSGLVRYTCPVRSKLAQPLAAGLWLASPVIRELQSSRDEGEAFKHVLANMGLTCHTLNAFPYGDFHSVRVKDAVYLPDWTSDLRCQYTVSCAQVLSEILPNGVDGSISTVPLGFKRRVATNDFVEKCITQLLALVRELEAIRQRTGRTIRLAIEPEPLCVLETTDETVQFFQRLWKTASVEGYEDTVREFLGVCFDICHQAVEFEDVPHSIAILNQAGIRINKVHISCALQLDDWHDTEARAALARYAEPRYLHQTFARTDEGRIIHIEDLSSEFVDHPSDEFKRARNWRVHFHVPVDAEFLGPLSTTRRDLVLALHAIAALTYAPHLEVETYTWEVMPGRETVDLVDGLTSELTATSTLLNEIRNAPK